MFGSSSLISIAKNLFEFERDLIRTKSKVKIEKENVPGLWGNEKAIFEYW